MSARRVCGFSIVRVVVHVMYPACVLGRSGAAASDLRGPRRRAKLPLTGVSDWAPNIAGFRRCGGVESELGYLVGGAARLTEWVVALWLFPVCAMRVRVRWS